MSAAVRVFLFSCAAVVAAAQAFAVVEAEAAPPVMRVKARLAAFDGTVMQLQTLPAKNGKQSEDFSVSVTPQTRYVGAAASAFSALKAGDYAGAAVTEQRGGRLRAEDVYLYADGLRGTGEGRFPEGERLMLNGTISAVSSPDNAQNAGSTGGNITLHYRGAVLNSAGPGRTVCEGRASPPAFTSPLACQADAVIEVRPGTPVSALAVGDKDLLRPGALVTVAMTKAEAGAEGAKNIGNNVAVGVVVEPPEQPPAKNGTVEKPQSSP